jgi:hypothetical protein
MKSGMFVYGSLLFLIATGVGGGFTPSEFGALLARYTGLGFQHIIPQGLDHICFVLGLFLLSRSVASLFWQVTAFTLAHSLTFGLMLYGFVEVPARAVEVAVALSIAFIAVENLCTTGLGRWRTSVVFGFGLVHGLAFAHTFREQSVPAEHFAPALIAFNVGIELGQLAVVALAFSAFGAFWRRPWYRQAVTIPASSLIAAAGLGWAVLRFSA